MFKKKASVLAGLLLVASSAMATDWVIDGKISGTPHDLSAVTGMGNSDNDNGEICVYCHTPHAANNAFSGAPLWNKAASSATSYLMYGASATGTAGVTIAGTAVGDANGTLSSPSLACLSCHDGVSAVDSILNAPGSGMGTDAGDTDISTFAYGGNIGGGTNVDMANDHPVSVAYTPGRASLKPVDTVLTNWVGANDLSATSGYISELLRNGNVECSSCHDPHNGYANQSGDADNPQVNYLRHTNAASALCLGCHDK